MNRILVVEDDISVLHAVCGALRGGGTQIESATTLRSARQRVLADDPYDIVICEHHLSDGNGLELLAWLRWKQHIPVPFLLIARSRDFAADIEDDFSVLAPPIRSDRIMASVNRLLRRTHGVIACQIPFAGEREF